MQSWIWYVDKFFGAMDAHWQRRKVCDVELTLSRLWTLASSGETP
jgi:hypothetical protein